MIRLTWLTFALFSLSASVAGQEMAFAAPTTKTFYLLVDGRVEDPPRYSGQARIPLPRRGDSVSFQVFMPHAAGLEAYGFQLAFQDTGRIFSDYFDLVEARTDARPLTPSPDGRLPGFRALQLDSPRQSSGPHKAALLMTPWHVSYSGLVAVIKLLAKQDIPPHLPLVLDVNVTVVSKTPPTRLFTMEARQEIGWGRSR